MMITHRYKIKSTAEETYFEIGHVLVGIRTV